jgi:hypothetical protein
MKTAEEQLAIIANALCSINGKLGGLVDKFNLVKINQMRLGDVHEMQYLEKHLKGKGFKELQEKYLDKLVETWKTKKTPAREEARNEERNSSF